MVSILSHQIQQRLLISATRRMSCIVTHMAHPVNNKINGLTDVPCKEIKIPVPWGHIAAKEWGVKGGRKILGLHGWQDNCGTFDPLVPFLPKDIHFVAVDLPGHGLSSHRHEGSFYHAFDWIADVRRIVNYLQWSNDDKAGGSRFSMISHSMGSTIALVYAGCYPADVDKIVMFDSIKLLTRPVKNLASRVATGIDRLLAYEGRDKLAEARRDISVDDAIELLEDAMDGSVTEKSAIVLLKRGSKPSGNGSRITFNRDQRLKFESVPGVTFEQFVEIASNVQSELLIVVANEGIAKVFAPPHEIEQTLQAYRDNCKSFKLVKVDGTHHVHLNAPEKVAPHVIEFLNS